MAVGYDILSLNEQWIAMACRHCIFFYNLHKQMFLVFKNILFIYQQPKKKQKKQPTATSYNILSQLEKVQEKEEKEEKQMTPCRCSKYSALKTKYLLVKQEKSDLAAKVEELMQFKGTIYAARNAPIL